MSEADKGLPHKDRSIDPYEEEPIDIFDVNSEQGTAHSSWEFKVLAYIFAALAMVAAYFQVRELVGFALLIAILLWIMYRLSCRNLRENERFILTGTHFLLLRTSLKRAHHLSDLKEILVSGSERDTDNQYCLVFPDGLTYRMSCGDRSKTFVSLISKATGIQVREGPLPSLIHGLPMFQGKTGKNNH